MSTPYGNLPTVDLPDRWDFRLVGTTVTEDGEGNTQAVMHITIEADSAEEAELRSLAVVDYDYEDDLRGAVAQAWPVPTNGVWLVDITTKPGR